jgi:hypothetical protein
LSVLDRRAFTHAGANKSGLRGSGQLLQKAGACLLEGLGDAPEGAGAFLPLNFAGR